MLHNRRVLYEGLQGAISKQSDDLFDAFGYLSSLQSTPSVCNVYFFLALMCGTSHNACTPQALNKYDLWKT